MLTRLLFALYFIETGLLLVVAPWTPWWRRNLFAELIPGLPAVMASVAGRGVVIAAGLVTLAGGLHEARAVFSRRARDRRRLPAESRDLP